MVTYKNALGSSLFTRMVLSGGMWLPWQCGRGGSQGQGEGHKEPEQRVPELSGESLQNLEQHSKMMKLL